MSDDQNDQSFFHDYVPPSKRPKPPTPPPEPKETNPWLISPATPGLDPDANQAAPDALGTPGEENNPWLISAPSPGLAPATEEDPTAPAPAAAQIIPVAFAAFPVRRQAKFLSISLFRSSSNNPLTLEIAGYSGQQCPTSAQRPALLHRITSSSPKPEPFLVQ